MGKIKRKKLSSFETKTLSELKELNDNGDKVYVPYIQPAYNNYKHEISECPQKLSAGENIQITDEGIVNAVDTCYSAGYNIKIDTEGKISYTGDEPQTYAAGKGLRLISNNNNLALKLETDAGKSFTSLYGSKLHPATFENNCKLELAGNAMDSIFVHINESDRTGGYKVLRLENDAITLRTSLDAGNTKYYYTNGTASGWYLDQKQPTGYTKVNSSDYTNFVIDTENIALLSMSALFLQKHNNMEIVINIVNRTSATYTDFIIENDTLYKADVHVYEQGLMSSCAVPSNNYGVIAKHEGNTLKTGFTAGHYVDTDGSGRSARPPFCGNVLSILDKTEDMYEDLYSTIRFIPLVSLDDTAQTTTIKLVSTEY